jgi:hypothetical protein
MSLRTLNLGNSGKVRLGKEVEVQCTACRLIRDEFAAYPVSTDVKYSNGTFNFVPVHIVQDEGNVDYFASLQLMGAYGGKPQAGHGEVAYQHLAFLARLFIYEVSSELSLLAVASPELDDGNERSTAGALDAHFPLGGSEGCGVYHLPFRAVWADDRYPVILVGVAALNWGGFFVHESGSLCKRGDNTKDQLIVKISICEPRQRLTAGLLLFYLLGAPWLRAARSWMHQLFSAVRVEAPADHLDNFPVEPGEHHPHDPASLVRAKRSSSRDQASRNLLRLLLLSGAGTLITATLGQGQWRYLPLIRTLQVEP